MPGNSFEGGIPVVKVKNIYDGVVHTDELLLTDPAIDAKYERSRLNADDILLTIRGTTGRTAQVPPELHGANITQDTARISIDTTFAHPKLVQFILQSRFMQEQINLMTIGQAVKGINIKAVRNLEFGLPPLHEQDELLNKLEAIDAFLNIELSRINTLEITKNGLLQDLLTGKVRVNTLDLPALLNAEAPAEAQAE